MNGKVAVVMGSDSDLDIMTEAVKVLHDFEIGWEILVSSAHRSPEKTAEFARTAEEKGFKVIIAGAGAAAHLAGVLAAETTLPVIGIPIPSSPLKGIDALLATAQMPGGIPVATMALGKAGAKNAALLAVEILALENDELNKKIKEYRKKLARGVEEKDKKVREVVSDMFE